MAENSSSIGKNAFFNTIKSISSIVFPFITFPYITRVLLTDNVGKINFGTSIISYFALIASLGINTYAIRECSKCRDDKQKMAKVANEIFSLNIVTTLISYALLLLTIFLIPSFENYRILIIIQSLSIMFTTLGTDWINNVMEDFGYITARTLIFQVVSLVPMFIFVRQPDDYIKYAIIVLISSSGSQITNMFYRRKYFKLRFTKDINFKKHLKPVLLLFSMQLAMVVYVNSDTTMLGFMKGDTEVGLYSVSVKIYNIVQTLVTAVQTVLIPQLAIGFAKKDYEKLKGLLRYAFNFMLILGLPCIMGVCLIAEGAVVILSGEAYLGSVMSLRILMIALGASFMAGYLGNLIMLPSGRDKLSFVSSLVSAIVNIILNFILIPIFGLNAAAFTTFVSMLIGFFIKLPFVDKKLSFDYIKKDVWSPVLGCLLMVAAGYGVGLLIDGIVLKTLVQIAVCVAVYFITLVLMKNQFFFDIINGFKKKFKRS